MSKTEIADSRRYTIEKRVRIVQLYSESSSCRYVQKNWEKQFKCSPPTANTINRIYQKFLATGSVANLTRQRVKPSRTEENVTKVKEAFKKNPGNSIRKVALELSIPHSTVSRILYELKGPEGGKIKRARSLKLGTKIADYSSRSKMNSNSTSAEQSSNNVGTPSSTSLTANLMFTVNFAAEKHKNQRRKDPEKTPYINHPVGVAQILIQEGHIEDLEVIQAALLHDTVEDTDTTIDELKDVFGPKISSIVAELTDNKLLPKEKRKAEQIAHALDKSHEAKVVGMADKIYNLRDLKRCLPSGWDEKRRAEYFVWAKKVCVSYYSANSHLASILQSIFVEQGLESEN